MLHSFTLIKVTWFDARFGTAKSSKPGPSGKKTNKSTVHYMSPYTTYFSVSEMMAVANCSAGVFNNPPSIADFFHSFSHPNFSFHEVSSIFIPTSAGYQQVWNVLFCYCREKLENLSSCAFELLFRFTRSRLQNVMTMSDRTQNVRWKGRERLLIFPSGYWPKMFLWSRCSNLHFRQSVSETS